MKYTKLFNNHSEYEEYMASDNAALPNLSWCIQEDEGHFTPYVIETKLVAKFNVTSTSEPTQIMSTEKYAFIYISSMEIDGVVQPSIIRTYTFDTLGEHTVKYTLVDNTTGRVLLGCSNITDITIPNSVTTISDMAFHSCTSLTSVTIPNSVTSIGHSAFEHCSSLTGIGSVGSGASVEIPNSVTSIGRYAFDMCTGLTSIDIPNGVTTIGYYVFSNCTSLSSITVDSNNSTFDSRNNCNGIIETATNTLVAGCKNTIIPSTVTSIGDYAFAVCTNLTSITIPDSVTSIGEGAFMYCSGLTSIDIPSGVTSIGQAVFQNCTSLSSITVDGDNDTFDSRNNCNAVIETSTNELVVGCKDTIIPNTVTSIGDSAFVSCNFSAITIPNSVTSIGEGAFMYCSGLTSIVIPNSVTSIGDSAFRHCENIESIEIPDSVTSIGDNAFQYSSGLTEVLIGTGITSIGEYAFDECEKLEKLTILAATPPSIGYAAFSGYNLVIYVPDDYVETYKTAPRWSYYSDRIQGLGCTPGHVYTLLGDPSYPSTVAATATSFQMSFDYDDVYTSTACESSTTSGSSTVLVTITANPTTSTRTISGSYDFNGLSVPYSLTQEGQPDVPYLQKYLTFDVLTGGTIKWKSIGSGQEKTISYSKDNGSTWTEITATSGGVEINVETGDKVLIKGTNSSYALDKNNYSGFDGGTALYNVEGNIMSLVYGDNFVGNTAMTGTYNFCSLFKNSNIISAENLILPSTTLTEYCYRAMFSFAISLTKAPQLPAMTLAKGCYWYMFEKAAITTAPDLLAETLVAECYGNMFASCSSLNYIKCMAASGFNTTNCKQSWVSGVASSGTFVKASSVEASTWTRGVNGIPANWLVYDDEALSSPTISYDGFSTITLTCVTEDAVIHYRLNQSGEYAVYATPITISEDTFIEAYSTKDSYSSITVSENCEYVSDVPIEYSNRDLKKWKYSGNTITTPYSVNGIDGHSAGYAKGTFTFETSFALKEAEPTYLWFQHADQSATIYIDDTLVEKHWGGYAAFTTDISNYVHQGVNRVKVSLKNNEGDNLAPASADFNFNATLGNVKLLTSQCVPAMNYGYDGFHITSTVSDTEATMNIKTNVPTGATLVCKIDDGNTNIYSATSASTGEEMTFTKVITSPHLWDGTLDPHMYTVTLEIYKGNDIYHRFVRPYGLRYYEYVINDTEKVGTSESPYTGFLLNGHKYLLRGCCMHDDIAGKANALNDADYTQTFSIIQELGLNFLRLAHYPHPKEVYDWCDRLGIVVQTEGPCVNKLQSTMPEQYYTHLTTQYTDMVNQHYNHPCIFFWGLSNETSTDNKNFGKQKVEEYTALIKNLDSERMVGYVLAQGNGTSPSAYYNDPSNVDWFGCNIYVGWYDSPNSNNPSSQITTRLNNTINRAGVNKPMAYSEYGCGGTQRCHSSNFMYTTTRGNNPRHDIEYMMWLHEGHIAAIKNKPELIFTSQWQLFDIAVSSRKEGYKVCLDDVNVTDDNNLKFLNNKGLVERDHVTKKDTFYLYKAWWSTTSTFVHICGKNYQKIDDRVIKCYTNETGTLTMYINGASASTATVTNNIAEFAARDFTSGDVITVSGGSTSDSFTISGISNSHAYVEIGGVKWATMNIGASNITDYGKYFQWADISGYTASQVGTDKVFNDTDYKYYDTKKSSMSKYNTTDKKIELEASDDAATAAWGSSWRMPTNTEFQALGDAVNSAWTSDYQGSGVAGLVCTDKTDSTKVLFFPAAGDCYNSNVQDVGSSGNYWSHSLNVISRDYAYGLFFDDDYVDWNSGKTYRCLGCSIRPVKDV